MTKSLRSKVMNMKPSGIRKFFDIISVMNDAISMGVVELDFDILWHFREEGVYSLEKGKTFYTSNAGLKELRQAISDNVKKKRNLEYNPDDEILVTVGGSEAIDIGLRAIINEGDEVIIPQPSYVSYEPCALLADAKPVIINLKGENNFRLQADELINVISDKTKVLILPYPNNPTGAIMEYEDLEKIAKIIIDNDIYVMSDEIYSELTYKEKHVSIASLDNMKERTILIDGFSKAYAMTGWRLGYACAPKEIIKQMTKIHQFAIMCAPTSSQYAAISALKNGDKDIEMMRTSYNQRRRFLLNAFREMNLECFEPYGAFYVFPSIKEFNMTSEEFATRFLEEEHVAAIPGNAFGDSGEGYLRISYAYSIENLKEAISRLKRFVEKLRKEQK